MVLEAAHQGFAATNAASLARKSRRKGVLQSIRLMLLAQKSSALWFVARNPAVVCFVM